MDFKNIVDNVANKAGTLAKSAAKKTGEVAEHTKLRIAAKVEKSKLEDMYTTLGKLFYEQVKGTDVRVQIAAQIMEIDEQKLTISNLVTEAAAAKGCMICANCGKEMDFDATFCPHCGKKPEAKKPNIHGDGEDEDTVKF